MLLSCSVFVDKILDGTKKHTIRFRQKPPTVGDISYIWKKSRTADRQFLAISVVTRVDNITIDYSNKVIIIDDRVLDIDEIQSLAINDGFDNEELFWEYFKNPMVKHGYVIHWDPDYIQNRRILERVRVKSGLLSSLIKEPKIYTPSNGSETMDFESNWCDSCVRSKDCQVQLQEFSGDRHFWIIHEDRPICTAYNPVKKAALFDRIVKQYSNLEEKGQLNILAKS